MPLDYLNTNNIAVMRLKAAHDPTVSKIRTSFFWAEYAFFARNIRNQKVLVAGSGLGHDSFELSRYNSSVVGIELHPELVSYATHMMTMLKLSNVAFVQGDFLNMRFDDHSFDSVVMNMGTIGTLAKPDLALHELLRVAQTAYIDFYPPLPDGIRKRIQMYAEEGWQNVRFDESKNEIVSDDGMSSKSISKKQLARWAGQCRARIKFHDFCDFASMAVISRY